MRYPRGYWIILTEIIRQATWGTCNAGFSQVVLMSVTVTLLSVTPIAAAEPKEEVEAAAAAWAQALGEDDPDKVLPLYANDAVLSVPYRRSYGPILQRCGTISWVPSGFFPV